MLRKRCLAKMAAQRNFVVSSAQFFSFPPSGGNCNREALPGLLYVFRTPKTAEDVGIMEKCGSRRLISLCLMDIQKSLEFENVPIQILEAGLKRCGKCGLFHL